MFPLIGLKFLWSVGIKVIFVKKIGIFNALCHLSARMNITLLSGRANCSESVQLQVNDLCLTFVTSNFFT